MCITRLQYATPCQNVLHNATMYITRSQCSSFEIPSIELTLGNPKFHDDVVSPEREDS